MSPISTRRLASVVFVGCAILVASLFASLPIPAAVAKVTASSAFVALALRAGARRSAWGKVVLLGLACSWFGDIFLIGGSKTAFLLGLVAFLLAHLAYVTAFVTHGVDRRWTLAAAVPVFLIGLLVLNWLGPHLSPELVWPVRLYTAAISLMVIMAAGAFGQGGNTMIIAGALMFFVSDLSVAALRVVETDAATFVWGLPLYYGGQVCFALSVSQSRSH